MFKVPQRVSRIFLFSVVLAGIAFGLTLDAGTKPQLASAGGGSTTPATCSISAWQSGSNPLSWGYRMDINAPNAATGSVRPGHPGIASHWPPYIISEGGNHYVTYSSAGNKTVYGRFNYRNSGSSTVIEAVCSRTVSVTAPPPKCTDPRAINFGGELPCDYRRGCTNPVARNYDPWAIIDDGSCRIPGCTNPLKLNFNPQANEYDGSCPDEPPIRGCTNSRAQNYNSRAQIDDGSCIIPGCTNPRARNYNPEANRDDGSCRIRGCTNSTSPNYNPEANEDDGSCPREPIRGCTDPTSPLYNPLATIDDGSCPPRGCTNPRAINYNPRVTIDDGSCRLIDDGGTPTTPTTPVTPITPTTPSVPGCTNPSAVNYNPRATINNGSCIMPVRGCTNPNSINYNARANVDDGSCIAIVRGCTDRTAYNFNASANTNDGSCRYDQCLNIAGNQDSVPAGLTQVGKNCYFPAPTCTTNGAINVFTGEPFTVRITIRNNSSATLNLTSVKYDGPTSVDGTPNNGSPDVNGNATLDASGSHTLNTPASGDVAWTVSYNQPAGLGNATLVCRQTVTVKNRPPTCQVLPINPANPLAGEGFHVRVRVRNPNPGQISISSAGYGLPTVTGSVDNKTGSATGGFPSSLSANTDKEYTSSSNLRVFDTNLDINVVWSIVSDAGSITCELPNNAAERPDIILLPPACTAIAQIVIVGLPFRARVSVTNPNPYAPLDLRDGAYELTLPPSTRANANNADTANPWRSGIITMASSASISLESYPPPELIVTSAGDLSIPWTIDSESGAPTGDCTTLISAYTRPYTRFYGNDVFAGGNYGETCTIGSNINAKGFGYYAGGTANHSSYRGTASELAVFAVGQIDGVLPGSQVTTRSSVSALGFSNTSIGTGSQPFGGNFGSQLCADDYWGEKPTSAGAPATSVDPGTGLQVVTLNTIANGTYYLSGSTHIRTTGAIPAGKRVTLYVDGNTWVGDSTYNGATDKQLAYDTSSPWADYTQIPLIRIITKGNIYVDNNITQLDGMYVAVPNGANNGEIHTCARSDATDDLRNPTLDKLLVASNCTKPLLVNGAFVAKRVHLLRLNGNIGSAPLAPEAYNSGQQAETFRFSPELYLALLTQGGGAEAIEFDAILTLPPAL